MTYFLNLLNRIVRELRFLFRTKFSNSYFFKLRSGSNRLFRHRGTRADRGVINQVFYNNDYSLHRLKREPELLAIYNSIVSDGKVPLIIDAGANIGASVVWFADQFQKSHIVAFEPDPDNFELLTKNAAGLNVQLHRAAVGSTDAIVSIIDPGEGEWGYRTQEDSNGSCRRVSLSRVLKEKQEKGHVPFLIKIDIEGGEENLFESSTEWVDQFPLIIIELHDWLLPKQGTSKNFVRRIARSQRDLVHIGENIFSIRN
jgi:FkbM family methyltransferase